jgi:hypothetical protein
MKTRGRVRNTPPSILLLILLPVLFFSCQSLQQDLLVSSSANETNNASAVELEETVVRLEASPISGDISAARRRTGELEKDDVTDSNFRAGRADTATDGAGEFQIEKGRALLELNRFAEAAAAFDLAFSLLEAKPFYREVYGPARNRAFDLKDLAGTEDGKTMTLAQQDGVTWKDLVEITQSETDLLRFLTAGRDWPAEEIFSRLLDRSFIPYTQDTALTEWPEAKPKSGEEVLRSGAAWFIWHLYAENRANRGLLSRYSSRYANTPNAKSPIDDLPLFSPFFDSVLGCVESEFMSLPDGKNFIPGEKLRGSLLLAILKKLEP